MGMDITVEDVLEMNDNGIYFLIEGGYITRVIYPEIKEDRTNGNE